MNLKIEIVRIAGIYSKSYQEIMNIFEHRLEPESDWNNMVALQDQRIHRNLMKIALQYTTINTFSEEHYTAIETELLDNLHHIRQQVSHITTNLNIITDSIKTKYKENIIQGLRTYNKVKNMDREQIIEYLGTLAKQQGSAMTILNSRLCHIGYRMDSECKRTAVTVDGKREYTRSYTFTLGKILTDENKKYLE